LIRKETERKVGAGGKERSAGENERNHGVPARGFSSDTREGKITFLKRKKTPLGGLGVNAMLKMGEGAGSLLQIEGGEILRRKGKKGGRHFLFEDPLKEERKKRKVHKRSRLRGKRSSLPESFEEELLSSQEKTRPVKRRGGVSKPPTG